VEINIPHLPSEIHPDPPNNFHIVGGFLAIQELARSMDVSVHLTDIFEYIQNFWLNIIHPEDGFSVFGLNIRTNNFIESFHSMLKTTIGQHPQRRIYVFGTLEHCSLKAPCFNNNS